MAHVATSRGGVLPPWAIFDANCIHFPRVDAHSQNIQQECPFIKIKLLFISIFSGRKLTFYRYSTQLALVKNGRNSADIIAYKNSTRGKV